MRAQRRTWKERNKAKNALFDVQGLESILERKEIELKSVLSDSWGFKNALKKKKR